MDVKQKVNAILNFMNKDVVKSSETEKAITKEAEDFITVLRDNLTNKLIAYDEAVARIRKFAKTPLEQNMLIFKIDNFEFKKTASLNNPVKEESVMSKKINEEIKELTDKYGLSAYGAHMQSEFDKVAYHLGTGGEVDSAKYGIGAEAFEEKHQKTTTQEGENLMKQHQKEREATNRASEVLENRMKKDAYHLGTGDEVDSKKWETTDATDDLADAKKNEGVGTKDMKEHERQRKEYLRASDVKITLTSDFKDPRKSTWNISDAETGELLVQASVDDILDGAEAAKETIDDCHKPAFKQMLEDKIDAVGLLPVAQALVGDVNFKKAADETKAEKEAEKKKEEKAEEKKEKAEEKKEEKASIDTAIGSVVKQASSVVKYYTLKGMLQDAKVTFGSEDSIVKSAESKIQELGLLITAGADTAEIDAKTEDISKDLTALDEQEDMSMDSLSEGSEVAEAENIEGLSEGETKILEDIKAAAESGDFDKVKELADEGEKLAKEEEKEAKKLEKEEKKEEKKEDKAPEVKEDKAPEAKIEEASDKKTIKTAAESKLYNLTNTNFQKDFHGGSKAKGDLANIHNIWEVKKAIESIINKHPNGKLASLYMKAKNGDAGARSYYTKIFGDAAYVSALFTPNTVEKQEAEQNKEGFQADYKPKVNAPVNSKLETIEKTKRSYKLAMDMQKKGLIKEGEVSLEKQVNSLINMDESSFNAYVDSLENLSPTTAYDEGRFKISTLDKPIVIANGKCVAAGFVDNKFVGYLTDTELGVKDGRITRAGLKIGVSHLRTALDNGILDGILSDGKVPAKNAEEVPVNVGQTDKPMSSNFDIDRI